MPPFPGRSPDRFEDWAEPTAIFTDGTKGCWDFRRYPQLWDPMRPWRAFARLPKSWNHPELPELWPVTEFFKWNNPSTSASGGYWLPSRIRRLFDRRTLVEERVYQRFKACKNLVDFDKFKQSLPWFDPLDLETASEWNTWREGREWIARTTFYIAELHAFEHWMETEAEHQSSMLVGKWPPNVSFPRPQGLMGVWAQTIRCRAEWEKLLHAGIPVYFLMEVPPSHPLIRSASDGNLDADERYRHNAFDASLVRHNGRLYNRIWTFNDHSASSVRYISNKVYLPSSIWHPSPSSPPHISSTAWDQPFTSYIYQDHSVFRAFHPISPSDLEIRRRERLHFAILNPDDRIFAIAPDPHPILTVLPTSRDSGITYYKEETDNEGHFWATRLEGRREIQTTEFLSCYHFNYPKNKIIIFSDWPFPGRSRSVGRVVSDVQLPPRDDPDWSTRLYYQAAYQPETRDPPFHTWKAPRQSMGAQFELVKNPRRPSPYPLPKRLPVAPVDALRVAPAIVVFEPWMTNRDATLLMPTRPIPPFLEYVQAPAGMDMPNSPEAIEKVISQQARLRDEVRRRFHLPRHGLEWLSEALSQWNLHSHHITCYPIRLSNFHGETRSEDVWELIQAEASVGDVVVMSSYHEVDTTMTFNLGFRYAEDALCVWSAFLGVLYRDRLLEARPVKAILGKCRVLALDYSLQRPHVARIERLRHVADREICLHRDCGDIFNSAKALLERLKCDYLPSSINACDPIIVGELPSPSQTYYHQLPKTNTTFGFKSQPASDLKEDQDFTEFMTITPQVPLQDITLGENTQSPKRMEKKRPRQAKQVRTAYALANRGAVSRLNGRSRHELKRALKDLIRHLQVSWKHVTLSDFVQPATESLVSFFEALWEWSDDCKDKLIRLRERDDLDLDFSSFDDAFGEVILPRGLFGDDYLEISKARHDYERRKSYPSHSLTEEFQTILT